MDKIAEDVWVKHRALRFFGVETGTRMTVLRLPRGLFVHSPIALDPELKEQIDRLGEVAFIAAPSKFHHLYVAQWTAAYPQAKSYACPGLARKRRDLAWTKILGDTPEPEWAGEVDQVHFAARTMEDEVVFFHRKTGTLVCCDFIFNLADHPSRVTRVVAAMMGQRQPGATLLEHVMIRDRARAREQVGRILEWDTRRIVLAHGALLPHGDRETVRRAYAFL
jgi:hypothetical protein